MENSIGLLQGVKILAVNPGAAVDTSGFEGVLFHTAMGGPCQARHGDSSGSLADAGASAMVSSGGLFQVHKPRKRFVALAGPSGTIIAILYGARTLPVVNASAVNRISPE